MAARTSTPALVTGVVPQVNLMPRAAIERRERAVLLRHWAWGLAAALAAVAIVSAGAFVLQTTAQARLAVEQTRTSDLLGQVAELQPVGAKVALQSELADFRAQAMGTDVTWRRLIAEIDGTLPSGIAVTEYRLAPGGLPVADVDPTTSTGVKGLVVLSGSSPVDIVEIIRDVRSLEDVRFADGWAQSSVEDAYRFELRIEFDQTVYTGEFAPEAVE